jgi:predicted nucleotidyltransferase
MAQRTGGLNTQLKLKIRQLLKEKGIITDKVVLFGSFGRGTEKADSDIDLIIVSRSFRNKSVFERVELTTGIGRKLVKTFKKPFDLMFYSDLEWEDGGSPVIHAAKQEGIIL